MHGDAAGCVFAAVGRDYGDVAGWGSGVDYGYGAGLFAGYEWELFGAGVGVDYCGGVCGLSDRSGVGVGGGGLDGVAVPVGQGLGNRDWDQEVQERENAGVLRCAQEDGEKQARTYRRETGDSRNGDSRFVALRVQTWSG